MRILYLVIAMVSLILLKFFLKKTSEKYDNKIEVLNKIAYNRLEKRLGIGFSFILLLTIIALFAFLENITDAIYISSLIFGPLLFASILLTMYALNWFVEVNDLEIIYRNCFGISKKYDLNKLELKYCNSNYKVFSNDKRIFTISDRCNNSMHLANVLTKLNANVRL